MPIVEPEVLIDGGHSTEWVLRTIIHHLYEHGVELTGMLLKPHMVICGEETPRQAGVEEVARATVGCLLRSVPAAVPGIAVPSGSQSDLQATAHLNAMNSVYAGLPWEFSFSYARALPGSQWRSGAETSDRWRRPKRLSTTA